MPSSLEHVSVRSSGVDERAMTACRIAAASDASALRKCDGGKRPLPPAGEVRALKIAAAMCAIALAGFPDEISEKTALAGGADSALAARFLNEKRGVCSSALEQLGERIKSYQTGEARAELRGVAKSKAATGVRKKSARGGQAASRSKPSGFGAK